jgi:formylmethanofuran dehydrogenase subunit C
MPKAPTAIPVEAECLTPERLCGLAAAAIAALPVWQGNQQGAIGDFFAVAGAGGEEIIIDGDIPHVKWLGRSMAGGRIEVRGACGMHAGSGMLGGELVVRGDAGDCLGAEMGGGTITVEGNAAQRVGAGYPGSPRGMMGGAILVRGNAGDEVGAVMGRGLITVLGDAGQLAGIGMRAGTILVGGRLGRRPGVGMARGSIVAWGGATLLPTFVYASTFTPPWLPLVLRTVVRAGFTVPEGWAHGAYRLYSGDTAANGPGEVLLWATS